MSSALDKERNQGSSDIFVWIPFFLVVFIVPDLITAPISRDLAWLSCALFAIGWHHLKSPVLFQKSSVDPYSWIFLCLSLIPVAIVLLSQQVDNPWMTWRQTLYLCGIWLVYTITRHHPPEWFVSQTWTLLLLAAAVMYIVYALLAPFFPPSDTIGFHWWRKLSTHFPGPFRQQNEQALFLTVVTLLIWRKMLKERIHIPWALVSVFTVCGILLTASRGGMIILLLSGILVWWADQFRYRGIMLIFAILILGWELSQAVLSLYPDHFGGTVITHAKQAVTDNTPSIRMFIWNISVHIWLLHPWFGGGGGMIPAHWIDSAIVVMNHHPEYGTIATSTLAGGNVYAHNLLLQFLVERGMVGASALILLIAALIRQAWMWGRNPTANEARMTGWMVAVILLLHGMISVTMMQTFFMILFALSLAVCFAKKIDTNQCEPPHTIQILRLLYLLPSLIFAAFWLHVIHEGRQLESLTQHNINHSPALQQLLARTIMDPWLHTAGMEHYFLHLFNDNVSQRAWSNSEAIALASWSEFQYANGMKFIMVVYHAQNNGIKELAWAKRYALAFRNDPYRKKLLQHAQHGHQQGERFPWINP